MSYVTFKKNPKIFDLRTFGGVSLHVQQLKIALEDENEVAQLIQELEYRGYSKAADTAERFRFSLWNCKAFTKNTGEGSGQPMDWRESTRN
jgi:hypothetical protein